MRVVAATMAFALTAGCSGGDDDARPIEPSEVYVPDFVGELVAADTSRWEQAQADPTAEPVARTSGGYGSQLLVGPGTLTLDDGAVIDVAPATPGGTLCPQLDLFRQPNEPPPGLSASQACLVIGVFEPGTTTTAWFSTLIVDRLGDDYHTSAEGFLGGQAVLPVGFGAFITLPVSADADVGCEMTLADVLADPNAGYGITFTPDLDVVAIECVGIM